MGGVKAKDITEKEVKCLLDKHLELISIFTDGKITVTFDDLFNYKKDNGHL